MTVERFAASPWKQSHEAYEQSPFNIRPAPEFATAEAVVASLYRSLGFKDASEGSIPAAGREFDRATQNPGHSERVGSNITNDTWRTVLHGVLESPKQPNQSSKRFLQLCPMVPDVALYSGSARLSANSWNPGQLIQRMVILGSESPGAAQECWRRLFSAMTVGEADDIWARWLDGEFQLRRKATVNWDFQRLDEAPDLPVGDKQDLSFPAQQFVRDLDAIVDAKGSMTRRQWVTLLEAVLRLGSVTHVLWLCKVNERLWKASRSVLETGVVPSVADVRRGALTLGPCTLTYANPAVPRIRDQAEMYLQARLWLNLLMWHLDRLGKTVRPIGSSSDVVDFLREVSGLRSELLAAGILEDFSRLRDQEARVLACKKGIGSNIVEFCRHVLGQRQTASETLRGYDQGYVLRKKAHYPGAPWIVSLGPVSILALVHCCLREAIGPRSIQRLCTHLAAYGVEVDREDIATGELGRQLRMLGLVLDSPDAETGMLLVPPFAGSVPA